MPTTDAVQAQQKPAGKSRRTVWVNHADVVSLMCLESSDGMVSWSWELRNGKSGYARCVPGDQLWVGFVPFAQYPTKEPLANSATTSPEASSATTTPPVVAKSSGTEGASRNSILAAITSAVKPFWRKIRKVLFIARQPAVAAKPFQPSTGGAA